MAIKEGKEARIQEIIARKPDIKKLKNINYRLIQDWEVPDWIKVKPVNKEEEELKLINLGKR